MQVIPQKRISKRIVEQNVDDSELHDIPQERISERIEGRIGGFLSTSSSAAVPLDTAEWLGDRGFRTFSLGKKSATSTRQSSANMLSHSSSWTPAPYQEEELRLEVDEWSEEYLSRHLGPDWRERARRGEFGRTFPLRRRALGTWGRRTSSRTGCQQRGCTVTARTRTMAPQEDAGLPGMENPHRRVRQTLTAKTVKDLICLLFDFHLTPGFYLDAPSQFADVSPNSALDCCIDDDVEGLVMTT